jgi:hypothetical protein
MTNDPKDGVNPSISTRRPYRKRPSEIGPRPGPPPNRSPRSQTNKTHPEINPTQHHQKHGFR